MFSCGKTGFHGLRLFLAVILLTLCASCAGKELSTPTVAPVLPGGSPGSSDSAAQEPDEPPASSEGEQENGASSEGNQESQEPDEPLPETPSEPKPGDDMAVPDGYTAAWKEENGQLILTNYTLPKTLSNGALQLPTGTSNYKITDSLFSQKPTITSVTIPACVNKIGSSAFAESGLKSITFSSANLSIEQYAFMDCSSLEELSLPATVTSIGTSAFQNCTSLKTVTFSGSLKELPASLFAQCSSLETVSFPTGLETVGKSAFAYAGSAEMTLRLILPDGVQTIESNAFAGAYIGVLYLPASVQSIDSDAFTDTFFSAEIGQLYFGGTEDAWAALKTACPALSDFDNVLTCNATRAQAEAASISAADPLARLAALF